MKYRLIVRARSDGKFEALAPAFDSGRVVGRTQEETIALARQAIASTLEFDVTDVDEGRLRQSIEINVLHGSVAVNNEPVAVRGTALALLIALAIEPRDIASETLCARLYPGIPFEKAYDALKMSVHRTRRQVHSPRAIRTNERGYELNEDVIVDIRFLPQIVSGVRLRNVSKAVQARLSAIFEDLSAGRPAVYATWPWFQPTERRLIEAEHEIGAFLARR